MLNTSSSGPSSRFKVFPRFQLPDPNPLPFLHLIILWLSYTRASLRHVLPKLYLCHTKYVQDLDHVVHASGHVVEKRVRWTEPGMKVHHPPSLHSHHACMLLGNERAAPSGPSQWCQRDVLVVYSLGVQRWRTRKEKAPVALQSAPEPSPRLCVHLFSRDVLQRKPAR